MKAEKLDVRRSSLVDMVFLSRSVYVCAVEDFLSWRRGFFGLKGSWGFGNRTSRVSW